MRFGASPEKTDTMEQRLRIALCDPNPEHIAEVSRALETILFSRCDYHIVSFLEGETLLDSLRSDVMKYDLIISEIDLGSYTGISMARVLRQNGCTSSIVFITENRDFVFEGYTVGAFDYLLKPVSLSQLSKTLLRYLDVHFSPENVYCFKSGKNERRVPHQSIVFFSSCGRKITLVELQGEDTYYGKIDDALCSLPGKTFLRPHQSYIVNMNHVEGYSKDSITMHNGAIIPISRQRCTETLQRLHTHFSAMECI